MAAPRGIRAVFSVTVYVVLDLEFPRYGLIRINDMDQMLVEVRKGMGM